MVRLSSRSRRAIILSNATYRDLNGQAVEAPDQSEQVWPMTMAGDHGRPGFFFGQIRWDQRLRVFITEHEPRVNWFFVHDGKAEGAGYFVGYESMSHRRVGFIGLSGFRSGPLPIDQWIPVRGQLAADYSQWSSLPDSIYWGGPDGGACGRAQEICHRNGCTCRPATTFDLSTWPRGR